MQFDIRPIAALLALLPMVASHAADDAIVQYQLELRRQASERIYWQEPHSHDESTVHVKLLGINDFHGQLSPVTVAERPAGGAAILAAYLKSAAGNINKGTLLIHAGDHVGASPPNSALLQDEPAISFLNAFTNKHCRRFKLHSQWSDRKRAATQPRCNVIGTPGNHEFDEGTTEMLRLINGDNASKGPFLESPWRGARFPYISANVIAAATQQPLLPPYVVRQVNDVRVGVIGAVLRDTPTLVSPSGIASLQFMDEATAINQAVAELRAQGVRTVVVTIHQGSTRPRPGDPIAPALQLVSGALLDIVKQLDDEVDVVISGHTHFASNALATNGNGKPILVTQSFSQGTAFSDIDLAISRNSGDVVAKSAAIISTWGDTGPGLNPDAHIATMVAAADEHVARLANRLISVAAADILRDANPAGESALANLIADAQRAATKAQFAFMNQDGVRTHIKAGDVTWGELFAVQPFSNELISMDLRGAQIKQLLEQQWQGQATPRMLGISGLRYTWDASRPVGDRVVQIQDAESRPLHADSRYRVTVNSFMAAGGDNFVVLREGTNRETGVVDIDALISYIRELPQPFTASSEQRVRTSPAWE